MDNFRSLVDFTWEPGEETLVLGYNGSGKTSALDALDSARKWAVGEWRIDQSFRPRELTRWRSEKNIHIEIDLALDRGTYHYAIVFDLSDATGAPRVKSEVLRLDEALVFDRQSFEIVFSDGQGNLGHNAVPLAQSAVSFLSALPGPEFTREFSDALRSLLIVRPMPSLIDEQASRPEAKASTHFENFVAWYWNLASNGSFQRAMLGLLDDVWPEFDHLRMEQVGREAMLLNAVFKPTATGDDLTLDFQELSEGERMLIVLYSLVGYQKSQAPTTIIIDEPDNFISLLELQPWLLTMLDECPDEGQIILVSHSPEIIRTMGPEKAAYFSRADHLSPTVVSRVERDETVALVDRFRRGWMDE